MTLIEKIREMIAEGETERSLKELYNYVKENNADVVDKLVMLRSRMQNMQNAIQNGTMDDQDAAIERAKINEAILKMLPQLTPEYLAQANQSMAPMQQMVMPEKVAAPTARNRKMIYIIGGILLVVVILIAINIGSSDDEFQEDFTQVESTTGEGTLLSNAIANNAVWQSNEQGIFLFESDKVCQEIINDQIVHTFDVVADASDFITLHDPSRNMYLRIGETVVQFKTEGTDTWNDLYTGQWVILSDE